MNHWLMKSEPDTFGIDHLAKKPKQTAGWDGVRNFQARNYLREMQVGDLVFFYHSSTEIPGVVGIAKVVREAYPDSTAFDKKNDRVLAFDKSSGDYTAQYRLAGGRPDWDDLRGLYVIPGVDQGPATLVWLGAGHIGQAVLEPVSDDSEGANATPRPTPSAEPSEKASAKPTKKP